MRGIGFCYLTQLARYAHIKRRALSSYGIVQDNGCSWVKNGSDRGAALPSPVDTHAFIDGLTPTDAEDLVNVGERTCFLHAGMRGQYPTVL